SVINTHMLLSFPTRRSSDLTKDLRLNSYDLVFRLGLTSFKHVGIFPEQAVNWDKIYSFLHTKPKAKFLNLFAYTGGASIAAKARSEEHTSELQSRENLVCRL